MSVPGLEKDIARLQRQQSALAAFGSFAFQEPALGNVLNEAARVCADLLGVPFCKICRYREAENDLLIVAGHGWEPGVVGEVVSQADETSPQGRAYVTGYPVIIQNLREANHYLFPPFYAAHGVLSTMDVIVKGRVGSPFGVLEIDSQVQHTYDQHDVDFLTGFANVLAEAVATAERGEVLRLTVKQMEAVVAEKNKLLDERGIMAEELKHRVRNNLQLVHAMLSSHLKLVAGEEEKSSVHGIIRRVTTLAEVYEQLLGTGMSRTVDLGDYLKALCGSLPRLQKDAGSGIELVCVAVPVLVGLDTVTAMGMVVAELVSNSFEHAFPDGNGSITVSLLRSGGTDEALLTVRDDGASFVERPGSKRHGVGLVRRLVEQVRGTAELHSGRGTVWTLKFPVLPVATDEAPDL